MSPEWIWLIFVFMLGSCVGSFLNVVIYRLPRDKSLVYPASACPACGRRIRFYDNIPLVSWLVLCGRCRDCKTRISPRYFVIELVTAMLFTGVFYWFFIAEYRQTGIGAHTGLDKFIAGGWLFYIVTILLVSAFLAASAIDLELWVIPLSLCWFVTAAGLIAASAGVFVINPAVIWSYRLFPHASARTGALAAGAAVGLIISLTGVWMGIIKRSYESEDGNENEAQIGPCDDNAEHSSVNDRAEIIKEIVFVLPIIVCAVAALLVSDHTPVVQKWWAELSQKPAVSGFFGSLWGYFVGGAVVWATRILGTLAFGREAMGLGDVHLMAAAGTVIGPLFVVIAFFVAPFFGLAWAGYQVFFKRTRQIPYGPFLSTAVFVVMIFHDRIWTHVSSLYMMN